MQLKLKGVSNLLLTLFSYMHLELKLRVFITGCAVAMVTYYAIKITTVVHQWLGVL